MRERDVVFLHGQPGAGSDWLGVIAHLPADVRAVALDRPGYQSNPLPPGDFWTNGHDLLTELDVRGIQRAVLVGHSFGGGVALAAAVLAPKRVLGLVLVASVGPGCVSPADRLLAAPILGPLSAVGMWVITPWFLRRWLAADPRRRPPATNAGIIAKSWAEARHEYGAMWRTFLVEQRALVRDLDALMRALPAVAAPSLLLTGTADTMVPVQTSYALSRLLAESRVIEVPGAGHHLPGSAPRLVAEAVRDLLDTV